MDVKTLCLGVLSRGEATGYEIRKHLVEGPFSHFWVAGFGSIYPALNKLSQDDLVSCTEMEQDGRPDKKVYRLTQQGKMALHDALAEPPAPDRVRSGFYFIAFFGHLLSPRQLEQLIGDRIAGLRATLARMAECGTQLPHCPSGERFVHGIGLAVYQAELDYLEQNQHVIIGEALMADRQVAE